MKHLTEQELKAMAQRIMMASPILRLWPRNPEHEKKVQDLMKSKGISRSEAVRLVDFPETGKGV